MKIKSICLLVAVSGFLFYCTSNKKQSAPRRLVSENSANVDTLQYALDRAPIIGAVEAIGLMSIEPGFKMQLVASEPDVTTPVAMTFDSKGRMWVAEMNGYMPDTVGTGEEVPNGKIVILEDIDGDGRVDTRKVFLDSLILPRAICLIENGILVAESPNLWFYEIDNDKPVRKTLVDDQYAVGGNVEHQPNGLLRALDNWIYNAKSSKRYRKSGNKWLIESTHFRGQWGISQDNYGRLYYNHNSANVLGDYFLPGFGSGNSNQRNVSGFNTAIVRDNRVYPVRPTPGVNRGYMKGILDDSLRLVEFTAACGPLVYRGDLFGASFNSNAFVPEPSANLIKRNRIGDDGIVVKGSQVYRNREFLASQDERFRPVNLYNAPDGSMYILDMYRGIIQHKTYLTTYLKAQIGKRNLTLPLNLGRIYKVVPAGFTNRKFEIPQSPSELITALGSANGWTRDYAQQTIIDRKLVSLIPDLKRKLSAENPNELEFIHSLWALEGLKALTSDEVLALLRTVATPKLQVQLLAVSAGLLNASTLAKSLDVYNELEKSGSVILTPYLAFIAGDIQALDLEKGRKFMLKLVKRQPDNVYVADALISTVKNREESFLTEVGKLTKDTAQVIYKRLNLAIRNARSAKGNRDPALLARQFPKGVELYSTICQTCHGQDGNGVQSLAPPLNRSEWVTGDKDKLISIILYGLTGPVEVNKHLYTAPEINGDMPGIGYDPDMKSEDIAQLLSFIRKSWLNNAEDVHTDEVVKVRSKLANRQKAFTVKELNGEN